VLSIERQCNEAMELLAAIQSCVDRGKQDAYRGGGLIPCRTDEFEVLIQRTRQLVGVVDVKRSRESAARRAAERAEMRRYHEERRIEEECDREFVLIVNDKGAK
jgi:hypothetical protein